MVAVVCSGFLLLRSTAQPSATDSGSVWQRQDIGRVGVAGSSAEVQSAQTLQGAGADIWGGADAFHFVYQPWEGDIEITARVLSVEKTDPWAKAGIMIRANLTEAAPHATVAETPEKGPVFIRRLQPGGASKDDAHQAMRMVRKDGQVFFQQRGSAGVEKATDSLTALPSPRWLKLVREGRVVKAYDSGDGVTWEWLGTETLGLLEIQGDSHEKLDLDRGFQLLISADGERLGRKLLDHLRPQFLPKPAGTRRARAASRSDCEVSSDFVREKTADEGIERMASIKNSVMNLLARQPNLPLPWSDLLRRVLLDETQHPVIRDYALQHAFSHYEEAIQGTATEPLDGTRQSRLLELFWAALERKRESLAGTALLGLFHLSEFDASVDRGRLGRQSLAVLEAAETGELARISGFQVCRLLGEQGALQPSVAHAEKRESIPLRVSAIAAVGALGGDTELPLLRRLLAEANPSVRVAAKAAVQRIQFKTNR